MTIETMYSLDPEVLLAVKEVNGHRVLASMNGGEYTYVLCDLNHGPDRFVTWTIWRTETGKIAASTGDYCRTLAAAVVSLYSRAGKMVELFQEVHAYP